MANYLTGILLLFCVELAHGQDPAYPYIYLKAKQVITPMPYMKPYISDIDDKGKPIYSEREALPFNYGITPVLLDSLSFYTLRDSFIADSNLVFSELKITDFDNDYCYECDFLINPNYGYTSIGYRTKFGYAADELKLKERKFIFYFVGKTDGSFANPIYYVHALMGAEQDL
jgi:hypothetical protein